MHRSHYLFVAFLLLNEAHYRKETLPPENTLIRVARQLELPSDHIFMT